MRPIDDLREKIVLWRKSTTDTALMSVLHDVLKQIDMAIYEMDHQEDESPWHRVEEPPKEEGKYLVYDGRGNYFVAWWGQRLGWCYDPKFFCYWMPIEPPKEDS